MRLYEFKFGASALLGHKEANTVGKQYKFHHNNTLLKSLLKYKKKLRQKHPILAGTALCKHLDGAVKDTVFDTGSGLDFKGSTSTTYGTNPRLGQGSE